MTCAHCGGDLGSRSITCASCSALEVRELQAPPSLQQTVELSSVVALVRSEFAADAAPPVVAELSLPGPAGHAIAGPAVESRPVKTWHLVTPDGSRHPIRSATVIGRSPMHTAGRPRYALLELADPTKSLSKTHALLHPVDDFCAVENLGAMNGVVIRGADGRERQVEAGEQAFAEPGDVLQLGGFLAGVVRD